ncbi:helix-turn-helix domain-containing protein [Caballeronia sp. LZ034LL]|uniref:helix-turn-helix domain-containing protein n=1 Tax=Caballeronia sp. LZ034LL TaxID=3038567 RepID=UPI0028649B74|nr:helix-turn-helix domain-containing protein [Caballeronia sp. LZ034LL]MDR5833340.1 helix-turn-helix domain-containing protein [Caballeronia sp. LZ034LL]
MSRFIIIPHRVLSDARFTSMTPLRVLMALGNRTDKNGWAFVKRKTLAESVGVSRARISQCIADLRAWGYIEVIAQERSGGGGQTCNRYRVLYDVGGPEPLDEIDDEDRNGPTPQVSDADPPVSDANPPVSHKELTPRLAELTPRLAPYDLPQ